MIWTIIIFAGFAIFAIVQELEYCRKEIKNLKSKIEDIEEKIAKKA